MTISALLRDRLDPNRSAPVLARDLQAALTALIDDGVVAFGARLPPIRTLAFELGCAPATVSRAYAGLRAGGRVRGAVGRGTFVGGAAEPGGLLLGAPPTENVLDLSQNNFLLEPAAPLLEEALGQAMREIAEGRRPTRLVEAAGWAPDRAAAAAHVAALRPGAESADIALTSGAQAGLAAAIAALTPPGGAVACDPLTYPGFLAAARQLGRRVVAIERDADGMTPDALDAAAERAPLSAVFLMPTVQNPTGAGLGAARREALAEVAARRGLIVIEDEAYGFLRAPGAPSFSALIPERTVLLETLSKSVAAALRVGFAAGPAPMIRRLAAAHNRMQLVVSPILTGAAAHLIGAGRLEPRIGAIRARLAARADAVAMRLGVSPAVARLGVVWLALDEGWRADAFAAEAEALGVRVASGREFAAEPRFEPRAIRISLAAAAEDAEHERALDVLAALAAAPYDAPLPAP